MSSKLFLPSENTPPPTTLLRLRSSTDHKKSRVVQLIPSVRDRRIVGEISSKSRTRSALKPLIQATTFRPIKGVLGNQENDAPQDNQASDILKLSHPLKPARKHTLQVATSPSKILYLCQKLTVYLAQQKLSWSITTNDKGITLSVKNPVELVTKRAVLSHIAQQLCSTGNKGMRIQFETPHFPDLYCNGLTAEDLCLRKCRIDKLFDLQIQSSTSFVDSAELQTQSPLLQQLFLHLDEYHAKRLKAESLQLQKDAIEKVINNCLEVLSEYSSSPTIAEAATIQSLKRLCTQAQIKRQYLTTLLDNLTHFETAVGVVPSAQFEAVDPMHRPWGVVGTLWQKAKKDIQNTPSRISEIEGFFRKIEIYSWKEQLTTLDLTLKSSRVVYLDEDARAAHSLEVSIDRDGQSQLVKGTRLYDTKHSLGYDIFVFKDGQLYANQHRIGLFHHSSFFAGGAVDCAGEIRCWKGQVQSINLQSGHYCPERYTAKELLAWFENGGINLNSFSISTVETVKCPVEVEWIESSGVVRQQTILLHNLSIHPEYNAQLLFNELCGSDKALHEQVAVPTATIIARLHAKFKTGDYHQGTLMLPQSFDFDAELNEWVVNAHVRYELDRGLVKGPSKIQPSSSSNPLLVRGSYTENTAEELAILKDLL